MLHLQHGWPDLVGDQVDDLGVDRVACHIRYIECVLGFPVPCGNFCSSYG